MFLCGGKGQVSTQHRHLQSIKRAMKKKWVYSDVSSTKSGVIDVFACGNVWVEAFARRSSLCGLTGPGTKVDKNGRIVERNGYIFYTS